MNRIVTTAALLLLSGGAVAQTLPSPQFATPSLTDSSNQAATTSWVRSVLGTAGQASGDLSASLVLVPGSTVARSLAARAATVFNVLDYGAVADGATDIGPLLNAIAALLPPNTANVIYFPAGNYALKSAVTFNGVAPELEGQGFTAGPSAIGSSGTWITISGTGYTPFTITGSNARGAAIRDIAISETQPTPAAGWTPTGYDYVFRIQSTLGEVTFDNVLFSGVTKGIYADNSGRLNIANVVGQFFNNAVTIDDCYDVARIEHLHSWPYWSSNANVISYQEASLDTVVLKRVDGIFVGDLFALGARTALYMTTGTNGVTTKAYIGNLYADFVKYGVLVDASSADAQFANVTTQGNDQTAPSNDIAGSEGVLVTGNSDTLQFGNLFGKLTASAVVDVEGYANRIGMANFRANTFGTLGAGQPAINVADSGTNPSNNVFLGNKEHLQGTSPLVLFNSGTTNGGRERFMMMNDVGGANGNEPRAYPGASGSNLTSIAAIGGDASIDLQLQAQSTTGSVRLQSNGVTVLRTDDANSGTDDVLFRSGSGTINMIAEGGDTDVDEYLTPKGTTGGVRMQPNGLVTLRTDNPNSGDSDLLVRPGIGAINLVVESASTNGSIILTPKGAGTVVVPTMPGTDNSTNAASTAFVDAAIAGAIAGVVSSFDTRTGAITLSSSDVTAALGFTPYSATNPSGYITSAGAPVQSVAGHTGTVTLAAGDVSGVAQISGGVLVTSQFPALTGDVATLGGSLVTTLATVNSNTGACGSATSIPVVTLDAKGRAIGCASTAIPTAGPSTAGLITTTNAGAAAPVQSVAGRTGVITLAVGDVSGAAPAANASFTGTTTIADSGTSGVAMTGTAPAGSGSTAINTYLLVASTSSTGSTRLTTDGNAAGSANCVNLPNNTAASLYIDITGLDITNHTTAARYRLLDAMMLKGTTAASTSMANSVSNASPNGSIGTTTGTTFSASADTTNGCLNLSVVAPSTDTWHWVARVVATSVQ